MDHQKNLDDFQTNFQEKLRKEQTLFVFFTKNIPVGLTVTYSLIIDIVQPQKRDPIRVRLIVG